MQRAAFLMLGVGLLHNIWHDCSCHTNYLISGISAFIGSTIALFQVFLHILPGSSPYGSTIFGLTFYAWAYVFFILTMPYCMLMMTISPQINKQYSQKTPSRPWLVKLAAYFLVFLVLANTTSAFLENGFNESPKEPLRYEMLKKI
jgi:hypothetical protein